MDRTKTSNTGYIVFALSFIYMVSYITRIDYAAVINEMVSDTGLSKTVLSIALTGSAITYGAGQIVSGWMGDRIQPKFLILTGIILSSAMNILVPFFVNYVILTVLWCINGFAQALMWPPILKLLVALCSKDTYASSTTRVSIGSSVGTIAVYLLSPLLIVSLGWRSVFFAAAAMGAVAAILIIKTCPRIDMQPKYEENSAKDKKSEKMYIPLCLVFIMLAIVFQGMLRDGVMTWMPSYIADTFNMSNAVSILTGVILPIFAIICFKIASKVYKKIGENPVVGAMIFFATGTVSAVLVLVFSGKSAPLSIAFMAFLSGAMHGVNIICTCFVPGFFGKHGNVSFIGGLLNSCTYVGSAVSTYGTAVIAESAGWTVTLGVWLSVAAMGLLVCVLCYPMWKKFIGREEKA